jgi:hypothetical protein
MKSATAAFAILALAGCTSVQVSSVDSKANLKDVCIVKNQEVTVRDFVAVLKDGFARHGIQTSLIAKGQERSCETVLTYSALKSWDLKPYLSVAELHLWRNGAQIGSAEYHLKGRGGFDLGKFAGTRAKMDPVIDQLLQAYR